MQFLRKLYITGFLSIFGLFLVSPSFALSRGSHDVTIMSSGFSDSCTWNIQCEKKDAGNYTCSSTGEVVAQAGNTVHQITTGKCDSGNIPKTIFSAVSLYVSPAKKIHKYIGPDTFVYPFVRVTKIQV